MFKNFQKILYCTNIFNNKNIKNQYFIKKKIFFFKYKNNYLYNNIGLCISKYITNIIINIIYNIINTIINHNINIQNINGFVYYFFFKKKIKDLIYYPDWIKKKRTIYIKKINILILKINNYYNINLYISTIPITYKIWIKKNNNIFIYKKFNTLKLKIKKNNLNIKKIHNIIINIDLEPENLCKIEHNKNILFLLNTTITKFKKKNIYNSICYDICHFLTEYEINLTYIHKLLKKNIKINKIQLSLSYYINKKTKINKLLQSNFCHQNKELNKKKIKIYKDLIYIYNIIKIKIYNIINIHFHLPIYLITYKLQQTNIFNTNYIYKIIKYYQITKNLEIETYMFNYIQKKNILNNLIIKEYLNTINTIYDKKHI